MSDIGIGLHSICNMSFVSQMIGVRLTEILGKLVDNDRTEDIMYLYYNNNLPNASSPANCGFLVLSSNLFVNFSSSHQLGLVRTQDRTVNIFYHRASFRESKQQMESKSEVSLPCYRSKKKLGER